MAATVGTRSKLFRSTAFRLTLLYMVVFALFATAALGYVSWNARRFIESQISQTIDAEITGLSEQFRLGGIRRLVFIIEQRSRGPGASLYLLTTPFGERIAGNVEQAPPGVLDRAGQMEMPFTRGGDDGPGGRPSIAIVRTYVLPGGFRLLIGRDASERDRLRAVVGRTGAIAIALVLAMGLVGGFVIARRVLSRVDRMSETTRGILASDLRERLPVSGADDELDRLAVNLNGMLDRIGELMTGLRQVSDNIAHDLKTPLTRLRNRADEALRTGKSVEELRTALEGVIEDADNIIRVFNALLMIARLEAGQVREAFAPFDVSDLASGVAELYDALAEEAGATLELTIAPGLIAHGSRELVGQALANLLDNALKYGRPADGSPARIGLTARAEPGCVLLQVSDRGPGIAPEDRAKALERFGRLDGSRSKPGFGLGLSLVHAVARIHHGTLELGDNGPGLVVTLSIPTGQTGV